MEEKVMHEGYLFQCSGNAGLIMGAVEEGNTRMKDHGRKILTTKARIKLNSPPMQCSFLTAAAGGSPVPCQFLATMWTGFSSRITCNGHFALTTHSKMACGACPAGVIKPRISNSTMGVKSGMKAIAPGAGSASGMEVISGHQKQEEPEKTNSVNTEKKENDGNTEETADMGGKGEQEQEQETLYAPYTICDYENCQETQECPYFNSAVSVNNDSVKLRQNFRDERKDQWDAYEARHRQKTEESLTGSWRKAAHHIIPGNNILMLEEEGKLIFGHLVKLANYFGYDVNNAWNCIMLPTNEKGYGEKEQIGKLASAYDAMWMMGRQWHSGPHNYPVSGDDMQEIQKYSRKHPEQYRGRGGNVSCFDYISVMREELNCLGEKYGRPRCWKKRYNQRQQMFIKDMNSLSRKAEKYLLDFEKDPKKSYPFYVSQIAMKYAFNLPSSAKIIVLYREMGKLMGKLVRMERYKKDKLQIIPKEKETIEITDYTQMRQWAVFCQNARHFFADKTLDEEIKERYCFKTVKDPRGRPEVKEIGLPQDPGQKINIMGYLTKYGSEVMAFIRQNKKDYVPAARIVSIRLQGGMGDE